MTDLERLQRVRPGKTNGPQHLFAKGAPRSLCRRAHRSRMSAAQTGALCVLCRNINARLEATP